METWQLNDLHSVCSRVHETTINRAGTREEEEGLRSWWEDTTRAVGLADLMGLVALLTHFVGLLGLLVLAACQPTKSTKPVGLSLVGVLVAMALLGLVAG